VFQSRKIDFLVLVFVCFAAFWWQLGALGLIDPDEPFYAQTAHEMVKSGDWLTPQIYGEPQFEKPIFYYWLLGGSFRALGETEFSGRLPTAVFATLLTLLTWIFGCRVWNRRAGFCAALVLATGLEFCVMSRLMLTDVPLAVFFTGAVYAYWKATREEERRNLWIFLHFVCTALAMLTKGPIGSLVPFLATLC
jgi:4-amino-4-deoxy-L-arabinose transferase-like glycosyltransferase